MKTSSWGKRARTEARAARRARALLAAAGLLLAGGCGGSTPPPGVSAAPRSGPIDFAFPGLDGQPITSDWARGKPTVIAFVTTGSLAAQAQVDFLVAMSKRDGDRVHYALVGLDGGEGNDRRSASELLRLYASALAVSFPVASADEGTREGAGPFGDVRNVPVTLVLDRAGRVVWRADGRVAKSDEIRAAMAGL